MAVIVGRVAFLSDRISKSGVRWVPGNHRGSEESASYDLRERAALKWALDQLRGIWGAEL